MIFLHGGGDDPNARIATLGRFVGAASRNGQCRIGMIVVEESASAATQSFAAYRAIFESLGLDSTALIPLYCSPENPLQPAQLEASEATGIFVCGGVTPLYHRALCLNSGLSTYLQTANIPFGGTSAGAAIAASIAILGGWQTTRTSTSRAILFQGASEGLDGLSVGPGLGLVPFSVDVHASQMGTLTRLIHAVEMGMTPAGWAIDENTMLQIDNNSLSLHGSGHAYYVSTGPNNSANVAIYTPESATLPPI